MEGFKRKRANSPLPQVMDQSADSEEQQINQVAEDMAGMDLQYHPVDEPVPNSYEAFVAQLPSSSSAASNMEQPLPMHAFNHPDQEQQIPRNVNHFNDIGNETRRDDSGIEMEEPSENVARRFVRTVHASDMDEGLGIVHFSCELCQCLFEQVEQLHDHLTAVHRVRL